MQSRAEILFSHRGHCRRRTTPHAIRHTHCGAAGPPRAQRRAAVVLFCPGAIPAGCLPACLLPACVPPCLPVRLPARSCLSPPEGHIQKLTSRSSHPEAQLFSACPWHVAPLPLDCHLTSLSLRLPLRVLPVLPCSQSACCDCRPTVLYSHHRPSHCHGHTHRRVTSTQSVPAHPHHTLR